MTEDAYENLKDNENSIQSEEYIYAYRLNGAMTQKQLKNKLKKITFNPVSYTHLWMKTSFF